MYINTPQCLQGIGISLFCPFTIPVQGSFWIIFYSTSVMIGMPEIKPGSRITFLSTCDVILNGTVLVFFDAIPLLIHNSYF